eukprot:CAMPEP_0171139634 /NCGR_PEP_ID=MMETSP0766_2-20121228/137211_1 /TAXON_ID=439317 /ORGANISM="Gambierdiscus australes, Strain CAWD 149" /LENGTH=173 /DNA_ID=CAMNT_0011603295 /DNA_START=110 /DNA_END=631 /DNA_ORIENTATION=-
MPKQNGGYRVRVLEGSKPELSCVPPQRVKRRFEPGNLVQVYMGSGTGWVNAIVTEPPPDPTASTDVAQRLVRFVPGLFGGTGHGQHDRDSPHSGGGQPPSPQHDDLLTVPRYFTTEDDGSGPPEQWEQVHCRFEPTGSESPHSGVSPAYLVRVRERSKSKELSKEVSEGPTAI